jgi:hypothetical protein
MSAPSATLERAPLATEPLLSGTPSLALTAAASRTLHRAPLPVIDPLEGLAVVGTERATSGRTLRAVPDGNRAAVIADRSLFVECWGRRWALGIKGVGAGAPLYGDGPLDGPPVRRPIVRESWMGESPFGAQGEPNARAAIARTTEAKDGSLFGLPICPVLSVVEIPEPLVEPRHHYLRFEGPIVQEHRLLPSNVRLFHGAGPGLGQAASRFVAELDLADPDRLHAFVEELLGTGLSALTLYARSLRGCAAGLEGLDLDDAWLDKDTVVARDGRLHFVDLESLDWVPVPDAAAARAKITRQLDRNAYDLLFAVDALLRAGEETDDTTRHRRIAALARLALDRAPAAGCPVHVDETASGTQLVLHPALLGEVVLSFLSPR